MVSQCQNKKMVQARQEDMSKTLGIMNVRDTLSHGDTHMPNMVSQCQSKKKLWAGYESAQTDGQTD